MRAALTIGVIGWALVCCLQGGNYLRIRWYLMSMLVGAILGEAYLFVGLSGQATAYWLLYSVVTACILTNAWLVSFEFVRKNPLRKVVIPTALASGVVGFLLAWTGLQQVTPLQMLMLVQAAVLAVAGLQIVLSTPIVFPLNAYVYGEDVPLRTIGRLWMTQAVMFYILAYGVADAWAEWLPTVVAVPFFAKLGFSLKRNAWLPAH